jgi:V/A-type H+-transporting ATPase subunit A
MTGKIIGISGPTVSVDLKGLCLYERVFVGHAMLTGEVVRIEQDRAVVQVYEDTRGLAVGEPIKRLGKPLTVRLGPGLLRRIFDGLQRPLERLRDESGPLITHGIEMDALDMEKKWKFHPFKKKGDSGEPLGYVEEGVFKHIIRYQNNPGGRISRLTEGELSLDEPVATLENGNVIQGFHEWPVRIPRPYRKKFPHRSLPDSGLSIFFTALQREVQQSCREDLGPEKQYSSSQLLNLLTWISLCTSDAVRGETKWPK